MPNTDAMSAEQLAALRRDLSIDARLGRHRLRLLTTWGLFSPRGIDEGTEHHVAAYAEL